MYFIQGPTFEIKLLYYILHFEQELKHSTARTPSLMHVRAIELNAFSITLICFLVFCPENYPLTTFNSKPCLFILTKENNNNKKSANFQAENNNDVS